MNPFALQLKAFRTARHLRQNELAEMVGYEQSYLSALEVGVKGPPTDDFLIKLVRVLELSDFEVQKLTEAAAASQRKIQVPLDAPTEVFWLCHRLRQQIDRLHPIQIQLMETALILPTSFSSNLRSSPKTQKMEAQM